MNYVITIISDLRALTLIRYNIFTEHKMDKNELLMAKREEILQIAARYGAHNVRVFGSVARGEAGPESDIDFRVDMEPGRSLFDLRGLLMDLKKTTGS